MLAHYFSTAKNFSNDGLTERAKIASQKIEKKPFVPNRRKGNEIIATTGWNYFWRNIRTFFLSGFSWCIPSSWMICLKTNRERYSSVFLRRPQIFLQKSPCSFDVYVVNFKSSLGFPQIFVPFLENFAKNRNETSKMTFCSFGPLCRLRFWFYGWLT